MKIQLRLLSDIVIKINYLLTAFALLSLCFAFAAADEDLSPLAEQYEDILPVNIDKIRHDKRKEVHARLDFGESSKKSRRVREGSQNSSAGTLPARYRNSSERLKMRDRLRYNDGNVSDRLGHQRQSAFDRLSDTYSPSKTKYGPDMANSRDRSHSRGRPPGRDSSPSRDRPRSRDRLCGIEESYGNTCSSYRTWARHRYHSRDRDHSRSMKRERESESSLSRVSESGTSDEGHWKSKSKRRNLTGDPEDHVKIFQAAAQVERWAMPTWCHMFNSTLIETTRDQPKRHVSERRSDFRGQPKEGRGSNRTHHGRMCTIKKQIEELVRAGKLLHLIKEIKQDRDPPKVGKKEVPAKHKSTAIYMVKSMGTEGPLVIEAEIGGYMIHRMYVNRGPQWKYSTCTASTSSGRKSRAKCGIIGRPEIREIQAVPSTVYGMLKFPVDGGIVTIRSTILIPAECTTMTTTSKEILKEAEVRHENFKVVLHPNFSDQEVAIGGTLSEGYLPVRKKKRGHAPVGARPIQVEVQKLVEARIMREVYYHDWLSNPVMVKKHDDSWRMCVDFTNLNKACPYDCYPLSEIDWKVESLCGYPFKCFLDAYRGYHQIQMAQSDKEKMAFRTDHGVYFYTKMPFGLKNAGATYQRLVDKALNSQVGRNIEVYINDLVIKSHTKTEMLRDIDETFRTLRKINMKLNPKKYTFETVEGMFLGFMIRPEGIKPCQDKTEVVLQLPSPWTIKEVQSLNGKLASLNRLLSKSAEKSLPLFKTLKKCIKKSDFHWTPEAEQAFKQLKQHLSELPMLVAPKPKEELIVYIYAFHRAISVVLMTERDTVQMPVYFLSHALQGPELNYTPMKKLVLALVFAAKRLRRYFQAHPIAVITNQPNVARRLQKCSIMLEEHNITYRPRTSVKGQILADFLVEKPNEAPPDTSVVETPQEPWTLFTDGSSCVDRPGAGLILTSPKRTKFTYALRFQFTASNIEAEYEELIADLRITTQMGVRNVHVSVDSKLVANQVLGTYVAKEENMIKYLEKAKSLEVVTAVEEDRPTWMTPIMEYLKDGTLSYDRKEASKLRIKARQYELLEWVLYRRSFLKSWLRCVGLLQADYMLREIHEGSCSMHVGPRSVVAKAMRLGYYWH
nr:reverse transcriptase domain-containing protein [Tanacetum cinerariifolium]